MLPGKKAFERLQWAFKNVLDASLAWLFYDLRSPLAVNGEVQGALAAHAPTIETLEPSPEPFQQVDLDAFTLFFSSEARLRTLNQEWRAQTQLAKRHLRRRRWDCSTSLVKRLCSLVALAASAKHVLWLLSRQGHR